MVRTQSNDRLNLWLILVLLALLLLIRLWTMWVWPLADTTEARYGDITRLIVERGYWLMPHVDANTPFFAKPALSMWLGALSASVFGVSEFALRFPHLLVGLMTAACIWFALRGLSLVAHWFGVLVFFASPLTFLSVGTIMTDATQMLCVTVAMVAAWRVLFAPSGATQEQPRKFTWLMVFYAAMGVGSLAKGLATLALIGMPIVAYAVLAGGIVRTFMALFSWAGVVLFFCVAAPWYLLAERAHPGFLQYFFIGEHFMRFLKPGWEGDRYGNAHNERLGTIWLFWAVAILPWIGLFLMQLFKVASPAKWRATSLETRWWWCWVLIPLLFFTFTRNLIWTYALTSIAPFAIVAGRAMQNKTNEAQSRWLYTSAAAMVVLVVLVMWKAQKPMEDNSARALAREAQAAQQAQGQKGAPVVLGSVYRFSSGYYLDEQLVRTKSEDELAQWLATPGTWLILSKNELPLLQDKPNARIIKGAAKGSLVYVNKEVSSSSPVPNN